MNYMDKVAQILNIDVNRKFIIIDDKGVELNNNPYTLTMQGLYNKDGVLHHQKLNKLLIGKYKIKKAEDKEQEIEDNAKCQKRNIIEWIMLFTTFLIILTLISFLVFIIIKMIFDVSFSLFVLSILKKIGKWAIIISAVLFTIFISLILSAEFMNSKFISNILDKVFKTKK